MKNQTSKTNANKESINRQIPKYSEEQARMIDSLHEHIGVLIGTADALFYRAEVERDEMLHLIADIIRTQALSLKDR